MRKCSFIPFQSASMALIYKKAKSSDISNAEGSNTAYLHGVLNDCLSEVSSIEFIVHSGHHLKYINPANLITKSTNETIETQLKFRLVSISARKLDVYL